mmetsp:Transcript_3818/g.10019  ORF Transcript_3818/g.10019 Transcript_3818/m.10019 type:complete len:209 (+) Transcript_3818:1365-1991(+)
MAALGHFLLREQALPIHLSVETGWRRGEPHPAHRGGGAERHRGPAGVLRCRDANRYPSTTASVAGRTKDSPVTRIDRHGNVVFRVRFASIVLLLVNGPHHGGPVPRFFVCWPVGTKLHHIFDSRRDCSDGPAHLLSRSVRGLRQGRSPPRCCRLSLRRRPRRRDPLPCVRWRRDPGCPDHPRLHSGNGGPEFVGAGSSVEHPPSTGRN